MVSPGEVFVGQFKFDHGGLLINMPRGVTTATWIFDVEARPLQTAEFTWRDPRGEIIDWQRLERYQVQRGPGYQVKLTIKDVTLEDMGPYPFEVRVNNGKQSRSHNETFVLVIPQAPTVEMRTEGNYRQTFFQLQKTYKVDCVVRGYPINETSLEMYQYSCGSFPKQNYCNENHNRLILDSTKLEPEDGVTDPRYHHQLVSSAQVRMERNIMVGCRVCSRGARPQCSRKNETKLLVGEFESGLEVWGLEQNRDYYEGDDVNISCTASKYLYSDVDWNCRNSRKNDSDISALKKKCDAPRIIEDSQHSYIRTLVLRNISSANDGKYICEATKDDKGKQKVAKFRELSVSRIIKPTVKLTNMNDTTIQLEQEQKFKFICNMKGNPRPTITWFRDGDVLEEDDFVEISQDYLELKFIRTEDAGRYSCLAVNRGGQAELFLSLEVLDSSLWSIVYGCIGGGVVLVVLIIFLLWRICYYKEEIEKLSLKDIKTFHDGDPTKINGDLDVHEQTDLLPYDK